MLTPISILALSRESVGQLEGQPHRFQDALGDGHGPLSPAYLRQEGHELVSAEAVGRVGLAQAHANSPGGLHEELVARRMAERVVDVLEAVEIEEEEGRLFPRL